jgi:hypothetical protein
MKVALEYSGYLRFIQNTFPNIRNYFKAYDNIDFYYFCHTWDCSKEEDIQYLKNVVKPHRYYIDTQKNFERHPYQLMNINMNHEEYKNDKNRLAHNLANPQDVKEFYEKPSSDNNYAFNKDLEVMIFGDYAYSHYPFNTLSLLYSIHQVGMLRKSFAQENNIEFDYVIRIRSDMHFTYSIYLDKLDKTKLNVFDASPHNGPFGKYTIQDQFAVGIPKYMNIYDDLFVYLACYYFIMKLDWISEILLGYHLQYNEIPINKIERTFFLLRYQDRSMYKRPTM